ncbi:hypothetical protein [Actinoplanes sp. NPDC026619]|uniref:hypothetical protein n=1 Tax=Actinoplanes sp. NPDC026619 TaxID=3155798 RepID=UPI00340FBC1E
MPITARTGAGVAPGQTWRAGVTVSSADETATATADLITTTDRVAAVSYQVANATGTVTAGDATAVTVTATNAGPSNAVRKIARFTAPAGARFGDFTDPDCTAAFTCTFDLDADASRSWTVPLIVSPDTADRLTGACVVADGDTTCAGGVSVGQSIARTGTITVPGAVIAAGTTGTAVIRMSATVAHPNLTLTVPLEALPDGITVTAAELGATTCPVGATVTCTGLALAAATPRELRLAVMVTSDVAADTTWPATGIVLANGDDRLTAAGVPVSTSKVAAVTRTVTVGTPTTADPAAGQTTVLPIRLAGAGTVDATIVLPADTTPGTLPDGCRAGTTSGVVVCTLDLPADLDLPVVVPPGSDIGKKLTGGCVDAGLGDETPDGDCDDDADVPIPPLVVGRHLVNLVIGNTTPAALIDRKPLLVRIPYANEGTHTADDVRFTLTPPAGVTVSSAATLLNSAAVLSAAALPHAAALPNATFTASAIAAKAVAASCTTTGNVVTCDAPDAAALMKSELWLTLTATAQARAGTHPMTIAVTTSSADGNATEITLNLTADATTDVTAPSGDQKLAVTGTQITGLAVLAALLVGMGTILVVATPARPGRHRLRRHRDTFKI